MVCIDAGEAICIIFDARPISKQKKFSLVVRPNYTVERLFDEVKCLSDYKNFDLSFDNLSLSENRDKKLSEIGIKFDQSPKYRNELFITEIETTEDKHSIYNYTNSNSTITSSAVLQEMKIEADIGISSDDDLALGASASPTESTPIPPVPPPFALPASGAAARFASSSSFKRNYDLSPITFVGLVNQAMTCYLNSLLQALFMTPEFRNALYKWEFDGKDEAKSIPYQLQKLFLNLQTSSKVAIETTDLTKSFGWDSSEAWQQHDIQELCRVMFDALENRFKHTKQSDLINRLYEGKMMDYVKCLECSTEKSREDTFLDIPLPVRPFGSNIAYESVEEALHAFVQPETLDGNNQYFCEKCNRKCDAHKGLKFTKFPYILTLHLKRFDFDYQTLHRIKLNDKVTFPQNLNVNSFISNSDVSGFAVAPQQNGTNASDTSSVGHESGIDSNSVTKCDDCSTTDSGSALEEDSCNGGTSIPSSGTNDQDLQEDDEGIDMGGGDGSKIGVNMNTTGPYFYDLFAIMIHSGSASGGHYYAYIKDFETDKWFSFNDQTVSNITQEDIQKSFGGSSTKTYYSSAYSSSTNAYMLMYRQMDVQKNKLAIKEDSFPEHIKILKAKLKEKEENDKKNKDQELEMTKLKIYFHNPKQKRLVDVKVYVTSDSTLEETLQEAYNRLAIKTIAPVENCRLVAFDHSNETIECSLEGKDQERISDVLNSIRSTELLLEVRDVNSEFEVYAPGGIMLKIYTIDMSTMDIEGPLQLRVCKSDTIGALKKIVCNKYGLNYEQILMGINKHGGSCGYPKTDEGTLENETLNNNCKIIVATNIGKVQQKSTETMEKLNKIVDETFQHILTLYFLLPNTDKENLERMLIPSYEPQSTNTSPSMTAKPPQQKSSIKSYDCVDAQCYANPVLAASFTCRIASPLPPIELPESNSEDSSLSDSDRTLVDAAQAAQDDISSTSNSPAWSEPRLSSPEEWLHATTTTMTTDNISPVQPQNIGSDDDMMNTTFSTNTQQANLYFKALPYEEPAVWEGEDTQKMIKVYTHKQMLIKDLKRELEPYIKVPLEYFKIFKMSVDNQSETECVRLTDNLINFKDGERLQIELGRALRDGEYKCKLYFLKLSEINDEMEKIPYLCETILRYGAEVGQTKREILAHIATLDSKYNIPFEKCRLRRKSYKNPSKIYLDDQKFGDDITLTTNYEMVLQEIEISSQPCINDGDTVLFVRRWFPSSLTLGKFQEITIGSKDELKNVISQLSSITEDNLEYHKMSGNFPRCNTSILNIQDLVWSSHQNHADNITQDGSLYLYRDKQDPIKELTEEERRELTGKENTRMGISSPSTTYSSNYSSRRRERALKIYIDPSPKKHEE